MKLREVMTQDVFCCSPSDTVAKVAADMKRHNVGAIPICEKNKLVGIITDRDIVVDCVAAGLNPKDSLVDQFKTLDPIVGTPDMELEAVARLMGENQIHRLPVVENGRLVGMCSLGDVALHAKDDKLVAQLIRDLSIPVRSSLPHTKAA